jgi:hypothetical protein
LARRQKYTGGKSKGQMALRGQMALEIYKYSRGIISK